MSHTSSRPRTSPSHAHDVAGLWGRRLLQSRILFLAGSDVLHLPVGGSGGPLERDRPNIPDRAEDARGNQRNRPKADEPSASTASTRSSTTSPCPGPIATAGANSPREAWSGSAWASSRATRMFERSIRRTGPTTTLRDTVERHQGGGTRRERAHAGRRRRCRASRDACRAEPLRLIESLDARTPAISCFLLDEKEIHEPRTPQPRDAPPRGPALVGTADEAQGGPGTAEKEGREGAPLYDGEAMDMNTPGLRRPDRAPGRRSPDGKDGEGRGESPRPDAPRGPRARASGNPVLRHRRQRRCRSGWRGR